MAVLLIALQNIIPLNPMVNFIYTRHLSSCFFVGCTHPGHRVIYAPGDSLPCRRDAS
ncbi:hypothetical protein [Photorhabdus australis]|uniref:hypothetical protein n=1 Tax=Photorhabdus australis TaxID=286156 RepID=UPI0030D9B701